MKQDLFFSVFQLISGGVGDHRTTYLNQVNHILRVLPTMSAVLGNPENRHKDTISSGLQEFMHKSTS